jgi:TM2 domain-containing membrane protein YozV
MPVEQTIDASAPGSGYSPYTAPPTVAPPPAYAPNLSVSPGLAFILGLIPGVGAIYNGQYAKGLIHVLILGTLISIASSGGLSDGAEPLFGLLITTFFFYMAFEAYHTAKRRQMGEAVDEFSSLFSLRRRSNRFPVGPILLIAIGVLFLLNNMDLLRFRDVARFWPVFLIAIGAYMLYTRLTGEPGVPPEAANEQR